MSTVHIIGAGLAGLAAAVDLAGTGRTVVVHEAAGQAGGRCRSFHDDALGCEIDNGNHLMLSGNDSAMAYLDTVGARDTLLCPPGARFPFVDLATGQRWIVDVNDGRIPWWIFAPGRRVADSRPAQYLAALRMAAAGPGRTVADCFDTAQPIYRRFWEPLAVAILNTAAEEASARLLWRVFAETVGRGAAASRPCIARDGLSHSLIAPALRYLERHKVAIRFGDRLRRFEFGAGWASALDLTDGAAALGADDRVVLAVPPAAAVELLPGLVAPLETRPIVNGHFRLPEAPKPLDGLPFLGLIGGDAQWLFLRGRLVSVTVSAATALVDEPADAIARRLWSDVARALSLGEMPLPPHRIVKEKRATFAQTPSSLALRPGPRTAYRNVVLAGDWTDTGLPATIEGAIRSGKRAAREIGTL
jgi:squalene-associated FAD-dependent desaturase